MSVAYAALEETLTQPISGAVEVESLDAQMEEAGEGGGSQEDDVHYRSAPPQPASFRPEGLDGEPGWYDPRLDQLPTRLRRALLRDGIRWLEELADWQEEDYLHLRNIGVQSAAEAIQFVREHLVDREERLPPEREAPPERPGTDVYLSRLTALLRANIEGADLLEELPTRARSRLALAELLTPAAIILISVRHLASIPYLGQEALQRVTGLQAQLAERFGLSDVAGTASIASVRAVNDALAPVAEAAFLSEQRAWAARLAAQIEAEINQGRLSPHLIVGHLGANSPEPTTLGELIELCHDLDVGTSQAVRRLVERLIDSLSYPTVDKELAALLASLPQRQSIILRHRASVRAPKTLEALGAELGVTRERVRQLERQALESVQRHAVQLTSLLRARSAVRFATKVAQSGGLLGMRAELVARGLILSDSSYEDFLAVWRATDLELPFPEKVVDAARKGLTPAHVVLAKSIAHRANKLCSNCGAFHLDWLHSEVGQGDLRLAVTSLGYSEIASGWYWKEGVRHEVLSRVLRKVFAVTDRISAKELRRALSRHLARREFPAPPSDVLWEVALRLEYVRVDGEYLVSSERFNPEIELNGSELAIYRALKEEGPVLSFQRLFEVNRQAGYATVTLSVRLKQSPIIRKAGQGLYALVEAQVDQSDIQKALGSVTDIDPNPELLYNMDGTAAYRINTTSWLIYGGAMSAPRMERFAGEWHTADGRTVVIRRGFVWGLKDFVDRLALQPGDRIEIVLDTWNRTVEVRRVDDAG